MRVAVALPFKKEGKKKIKGRRKGGDEKSTLFHRGLPVWGSGPQGKLVFLLNFLTGSPKQTGSPTSHAE